MALATTPAVANRYVDAVSAKDLAAVAGMFADDIVRHQPGAHRFSGSHRGGTAVGEFSDA